MQHATRKMDTKTLPILTKLKTYVSILVWATGLILAGSDGPMMPYINVLGAILFAGSCLWLGRRSGSSKLKNRSEPKPSFVRPCCPKEVSRYARPAGDVAQLGVLATRPRYARELGVV